MTLSDFTQDLDIWVVTILVILLLTILVIASVKVYPVVKKIVAFLNDVAGEEARPGRKRVPGLFERLGDIDSKIGSMETTQNLMSRNLDKVHHELFPNSGKSLRDQTNRIEAKLNNDHGEIEALKDGLGGLQLSLEEHIDVATGILRTLTKEDDQ